MLHGINVIPIKFESYNHLQLKVEILCYPTYCQWVRYFGSNAAYYRCTSFSNMRKGKVLRKHSLYGENEVIDQCKWKMPLNWRPLAHERNSIFQCHQHTIHEPKGPEKTQHIDVVRGDILHFTLGRCKWRLDPIEAKASQSFTCDVTCSAMPKHPDKPVDLIPPTVIHCLK